ncbi:MAG: hypothetical protein KBF32_10155 [Chitinophagales bacterium]|nr:hypothetical protein [Chitinophagales bacterium]
MHETKLIKTLRTLNRKELGELLRFSQSGLVTITDKGQELLELIHSCSPAFTSPRLKKEQLFTKLFKGDPYNDTKLRLLQSDLLKLANQYISTKMLLASSYEAEMLQLEHFIKAENNDYTLRRIDEFTRKVDAIPYQNENYFYLRFRVEQMKSNYFAKRSKDYALDNLFKNLEAFYFLNKLKLFCVRISNNLIYRNEPDHSFLEEIRQSLENQAFPDNQIILGYSYSILLLTGEDTELQFRRLFELLQQFEKQLGPHEVNTFNKILENHCIRQINTGNEEYYEMLFMLLERRLLKAHEIASGEVKTFITLCIRMGKDMLAQKFLKDKKQSIVPAEIREDAYNYSMALLHFYRQQYDQVLTLLQQVEYLNIFYKIDSKKLLIETFYELKEWDSLDSAMNAFRVFIHRNAETSDVHKQNNQNFINFLYKLMNSKSNEQKRLQQLLLQLKKSRHLAERKWLIEKVEERIKS